MSYREPPAPKVLLVAGPGRSGTSTFVGVLQRLGMHVPQPEVVADESNPKGFGESRRVVDLHGRLLTSAVVTVGDARPAAWTETERIAAGEQERVGITDWLAAELLDHAELVIKDPRLGWFLGLWQIAATRAGATPVFATLLRPPAEVVGSRQRYYQNRLGAAHLAASWINMLLHTEYATRASAVDGGRVFVRYADLLDDWTKVTMAAAERLGLHAVLQADDSRIRECDQFVDPDLRRVGLTLAELELPRRLHDLTQETWSQLSRLVEPDGDTADTHVALDQLRETYTELYEEAEAISKSSVVAATTLVRNRLGSTAATPVPPHPQGHFADLIPHHWRARIPSPIRKGVRGILRRNR